MCLRGRHHWRPKRTAHAFAPVQCSASGSDTCSGRISSAGVCATVCWGKKDGGGDAWGMKGMVGFRVGPCHRMGKGSIPASARAVMPLSHMVVRVYHARYND